MAAAVGHPTSPLAPKEVKDNVDQAIPVTMEPEPTSVATTPTDWISPQASWACSARPWRLEMSAPWRYRPAATQATIINVRTAEPAMPLACPPAQHRPSRGPATLAIRTGLPCRLPARSRTVPSRATSRRRPTSNPCLPPLRARLIPQPCRSEGARAPIQ